jgi:xanthine dehydrogenase accessory factor
MRALVFDALARTAQQNEPVALGIISGVKGSSPQKIGAKALFFSDGSITGTLGGGCLEAEIQQRALQTLRTGKPETFDLLLDHDFGWDDGLICGGKVTGLILPNAQAAGAEFWTALASREKKMAWGIGEDFTIQRAQADLATAAGARRRESEPSQANPPNQGEASLTRWRYIETVTPPCPLWIAGAGHIAQAVGPLAAQLDFSVTVFDDRPMLASRDFFPPPIRIETGSWDDLLKAQLPDLPGFALIVTRGHRHDALVLKQWISKPFLFIGMIGSGRKARTIFEHFIGEKIASPGQLARVACPVGIPIRSQSVQEIAVSIMAQFIEKRAEMVFGPEGVSALKNELV